MRKRPMPDRDGQRETHERAQTDEELVLTKGPDPGRGRHARNVQRVERELDPYDTCSSQHADDRGYDHASRQAVQGQEDLSVLGQALLHRERVALLEDFRVIVRAAKYSPSAFENSLPQLRGEGPPFATGNVIVAWHQESLG